MVEKIAVIGLGYVGLPVAVAWRGRRSRGRVRCRSRSDRGLARRPSTPPANSGPTSWPPSISATPPIPADLAGCNCFIVTVPTPIDANRQPDLGAAAARLRQRRRGRCAPGGIVVFESTVYPGVTEEDCVPLLAAASGLRPGADFQLGYWPERINPGDREHRLETITKVIAGRGRGGARRWTRSMDRWCTAGAAPGAVDPRWPRRPR